MARYLYMGGLSFAYVKALLYDLLRAAPKIELFYKLRGSGTGPRRFAARRIGYSGRTGAYKNLRRNLVREGILSKEGAFIENGPNLWLARLPERVQNSQVIASVSRRIPYMIFLAIMLNKKNTFESPYQLARRLNLVPRSTYAAVKLLVEKGLLDQTNLTVANRSPAIQLYGWMRRYLDLTIEHANLKHDNSKMFQAVPAYIDGLEALQRVKYEPGMPIGPSPMIIRTYEPFRSFWVRAVDEVDDLKERQRMVSIGPVAAHARVVWISGLPYSTRPILD
jgi:hypothetical protein